jgi:hypothetical protein
MRFRTSVAIATSVAWRPSVRKRSASPTTRFQRETSASIVCSQSRKRRVFPLRAGRDDVADLDGAVGDDHAVDQQLDQGPLALEVRRGQPLLHTPAECLGVRGQPTGLALSLGILHEILLLAVQGQ